MRPKATIRAAYFLCALAAGARPAGAQQILLEPVRAGELTLFRDLSDEKVYYYVSDKPRLATGADGKPEFSMLRWVENVRTGAGEPEAREGEGGGIVHALVTLAITPEQVQRAQSELQRQRPGGVIRGPVMYRQGTFGLVSSFKDPSGGLVHQVCGLGKAPLLDGEKAAVSFQLTKRGAQILWESLQTPTPDISFTFEMELAGFRPPARAILEADFDQIYSHKSFAAGIATTHLGGEIEVAFDDLRRQGGIKLTEIGDNADLHTLISTAYAQITKIMFETAPDILKPAAGLGPGVGQLGAADSMLDKATKLLKESRADHDKRSAEARKAAGAGATGSADLAKARETARAAEESAAAAEDKVARLQREVSAVERSAEARTRTQPEPPKADPPKADPPKTNPPKADAPKTDPPKTDPPKADPPKTNPPKADAPKTDPPKADPPKTDPPKTDPPKDPSRSDPPKPRPEAARADTSAELARKRAELAEAATKAERLRAEANKAKARVAELEAAGSSGADKDKEEDDRPRWAAIASFKMKNIRQRGKMKWDLNKYTESLITLRFDGNIGDVRQFKDHFREVNLWSPLYQQREVVVYVDGANASDFGQYVNFVTVRLRKRHAEGAVTDDEVLIDRNNFNKEGNRFKLLYGWKGDNDRRKWMEYEYQTVWSLFGGKTVEFPMQRATAQALAVTPPYQRRLVEVRGDAAELAKAEVRSVNVKLFYDLAGAPQVRQATLDVAQPKTSQIEFMSLPEAVDYEYEITWRLKGNRTLTSGRQKASDSFLDVGDMPPG